MNPHRTTDPHRRAEHIVNRLEHEHCRERLMAGDFPYGDWPRFWLGRYNEVAKEICGVEILDPTTGEPIEGSGV